MVVDTQTKYKPNHVYIHCKASHPGDAIRLIYMQLVIILLHIFLCLHVAVVVVVVDYVIPATFFLVS